MNITELQDGLDEYEQAFSAFVQTHDLPVEWFAVPDHFAVKCASAEDYSQTCSQLAQLADIEGVWELDINDRMLGSAGLASPMMLAGYEFGWVEIMQPRPGKETASGFVEHTEFLFTDFTAAQEVLAAKGITAEVQQNPGHRWINIVIDNQGREIKLNDRLLADVVAEEKTQGLLQKKETNT